MEELKKLKQMIEFAFGEILKIFEEIYMAMKEIQKFLVERNRKAIAPKKILPKKFVLSKRFKVVHCRNNC